MQVPLLIVGKKGIPVGRTVAEPVSLRDLPATMIDLLGLGPDHRFAGRSVARYWQPRDPGVRVVADPLLMETTKPELLMNGGREPAAKGPMKAVVAAGMHYIQMADGSEELYNINSDVEEKVNLAPEGDMLPVLVGIPKSAGSDAPEAIDYSGTASHGSSSSLTERYIGITDQGVAGLSNGKRRGRPPVFSRRSGDACHQIGLPTTG